MTTLIGLFVLGLAAIFLLTFVVLVLGKSPEQLVLNDGWITTTATVFEVSTLPDGKAEYVYRDHLGAQHQGTTWLGDVEFTGETLTIPVAFDPERPARSIQIQESSSGGQTLTMVAGIFFGLVGLVMAITGLGLILKW